MRDDQTPISAVLAQPKRLALLALLASSPRNTVHQRDTILGLLWSEMPDTRARAALNKAVFFLRQHLGDAAIITSGDGALSVDAEIVACDARRFDDDLDAGRFEEAAEAYRGPYLAGFFISDAPDFERWLDSERRRRANAYARTLERVAVGLQHRGEKDAAVEWWERLVALEPNDSRAVRHLMEALAANENPGGALRAASEHELSLRRDLDVAPDPSIVSLAQTLRDATQPSVIASSPRPVSAEDGRARSPTSHPAVPAEVTISTDLPAHDIDAPVPEPTLARHRWRRSLLLLGAAVMLAAAFVAVRGSQWTLARSATPADTTRYAILPFGDPANAARGIGDPAPTIYDALTHWRGISVVDPADVVDALGAKPSLRRSARDAGILAASLGAGRFLWGDLTAAGDSVRVHVRLAQAADGATLAEHVLVLPRSRGPSSSSLVSMIDALVLRARVGGLEVDTSSRSLPAEQAFLSGRRALESWSLSAADSAFSRAIKYDPQFARAHLWLATVRAWNGAEPARFTLSAEQASVLPRDFSAFEEGMARAILAQSRRDLGVACELWHRLTLSDSLEVASWYGAAYCDRHDDVVVRDRRSRSQWRFRSSFERANREYRRAFSIRPAILGSFQGGSFEQLRSLFFAGGSYYRPGHSLGPDSASFVSRIELSGDSILMVPVPRDQTFPGGYALEAFVRAVDHQRAIVREVASSWIAAFPERPAAWQALAIALAMQGDPRAPDTLAVAQTRARTREERLQLTVAEIWMKLAFGVSRLERTSVVRARQLADSVLLSEGDSTLDPRQLSALAALTGKATLSARYAQRDEVASAMRTSPRLSGLAPPLLVYAALGGPSDSVRLLENRVNAEINQLPPGERQQQRLEWIARAQTLCFPACAVSSTDSLGGAGDPLLAAQASLRSGRTGDVRQYLALLSNDRRGVQPDVISADALLPEAALFAFIGDDPAAADWLDPLLEHLSQVEPAKLATPEWIASLVRAMALRAHIAKRLGDLSKSQRLTELVRVLWSDADPVVRAAVFSDSEPRLSVRR